jgi:hypothetical protein
MEMERLPIFDPTVPPQEMNIVFAPRPESLRNLRIGLVGNTKYNSDQLLLRIAAILEKEKGAKSHTLRNKRNASVPVDENIIQEFKGQCDVVIAGIGD